MSLNSRHRGIDPRHAFLPPVYCVHRLTSDDEAGWRRVPPVPLLTDLFGEETPLRRAEIKLAFADHRLLLRAVVVDDAVTCHPERDVRDTNFWRQDHIELRVLPNPERDMDTCQFLFTAGGRFLAGGDSHVSVDYHAERDAAGWSARAAIPFARLGLPPAVPGLRLRGMVAHVRWPGGGIDAAVSSPTQLGFDQAERFGDFLFCESAQGVVLDRVDCDRERLALAAQPATFRLRNVAAVHRSGTLLVQADDGWRWQASGVSFDPGQTQSHGVDLPLRRPNYTRFQVSFIAPDGTRDELGGVTLRAAVSPLAVDAGHLRHPYLHADEQGWQTVREKAAKPFFHELVAEVKSPALDAADDDGELSFAFTARCAGWFRVAKESMVRDGRGGKSPVCARIWQFLPEKTRQAFLDLAERVTASPETQAAILEGMNGLLERRDFYAETIFAGGKIPAATRDALRCPEKLSADALRKHNRTLVQASVECIHEFGMDVVDRACSLGEQWLLAGDERYLRAASRVAAVAERRLIPELHIHLHSGGAAGRIGALYDAAHPHLTDEERATWVRLGRRFLDLYLDSIRDYSWTVTCVPNANPVGNGGAGRLALAMLAELPELAEPTLYHTRKQIETFVDYCLGADGGNTEGVQYWHYGMSNFVLYAQALESATGEAHEWFERPQVRKTMNMVRLSLCPDGGSHGQNDTIPLAVGGDLGWFFAWRYNDPFALWYGDHCRRHHAARRSAGLPAPYAPVWLWALLFRPDTPEAFEQPAPLPTAFHLPDIEYAVLRSGDGEYACRLMLGAKGARPPYTHHNQADTGAFFLHVDGERMLIDPGYYKDAAHFHCLPAVDGKGPGQASAYVGRIVACGERGDERFMTLDVTAAYETVARNVVRSFRMIGEEKVVVIDEIDPLGRGWIVAHFQCGGVCEQVAPNAWRIHGRKTRVHCEISFPRGGAAEIELAPEVSLHDTHWGYHFADCRLFPVRVRYAANPANPLTTAFTFLPAS